jgi:NTE family protein
MVLVDGGLVNPVPVSLCRAMGADVVIAVDLNSDLMGRRFAKSAEAKERKTKKPSTQLASMLDRLQQGLDALKSGPRSSTEMPSMLDVLASSINIMQVRITRSRLAGEPADILIRPRLSEIASMDYHRAAFAITEGQRAAEQMLPELREFFGA